MRKRHKRRKSQDGVTLEIFGSTDNEPSTVVGSIVDGATGASEHSGAG